MMEIVDWLVEFEERASRVYEKAAELFQYDHELAGFLKKLADEEKAHHEFMFKAAELVNVKDINPSVIFMGDSTKKRIDAYFLLCEGRIKAMTLDKANLLDFIASVEFSEWNTLFMYVTKVLIKKQPGLVFDVKKINRHKRDIEEFLASQPGGAQIIKRMKMFPPVWEEKILVVDDEEMLTAAFEAILEDEGVVETASNGMDGLNMIAENDYGAILTDVYMPRLDGIEFFNRASKIDPRVKDRFLFFTGSADEEHISFFKKNNLRYIEKPAEISDIRKAVTEILNK